jgi:hypothetical protein
MGRGGAENRSGGGGGVSDGLGHWVFPHGSEQLSNTHALKACDMETEQLCL